MIEMSEEELETRLAQTRLSGRAAGLNEAAKALMDKAAEAFERGADSEARTLRDTAQRFRADAEDTYAADSERQRWISRRAGQEGVLE